MSYKPILFSTPMVQAIMDGRKTMTRRVITDIPDNTYRMDTDDGSEWFAYYGQYGEGWLADLANPVKPKYRPGDVLWVRETHYRYGHWVKNGISKTGKQKWKFAPTSSEVRFFDNAPDALGKWSTRTELAWWKRPAIYMPIWAARLFLRVTDVRAERLQEITEEDAKAEGSYLGRCSCMPYTKDRTPIGAAFKQTWCHIHGDEFKEIWDTINAKRNGGIYAWDKSPWVWVYTFERIDKPEGWPNV